ncbi:hypothetical protein EON63_06360 [archaeon]|nr:MAG: hypothetical protein EON63_06360 [archaeon]
MQHTCIEHHTPYIIHSLVMEEDAPYFAFADALSYSKYGFLITAITELQDLELVCDPGELNAIHYVHIPYTVMDCPSPYIHIHNIEHTPCTMHHAPYRTLCTLYHTTYTIHQTR